MVKILGWRPAGGNGGKVAHFDFYDSKTGLEFINWRLVRKRDGSYFVASPGAEYESKGRKVDSQYVRIARYGADPQGIRWNAEVLAAALARAEEDETEDEATESILIPKKIVDMPPELQPRALREWRRLQQ